MTLEVSLQLAPCSSPCLILTLTIDRDFNISLKVPINWDPNSKYRVETGSVFEGVQVLPTRLTYLRGFLTFVSLLRESTSRIYLIYLKGLFIHLGSLLKIKRCKQDILHILVFT